MLTAVDEQGDLNHFDGYSVSGFPAYIWNGARENEQDRLWKTL